MWTRLASRRSRWCGATVLVAVAIAPVCACNVLAGIDPPVDNPASDAGSNGRGGAPDAIATTSGAAGGGQGGGAGATPEGGAGLGVLTRVSVSTEGTQADDNSDGVSVSGDGKLVAFGSAAKNLVFSDFNAESDIFLHNRTSGETSRVSLGSDNAEPNGPCADPLITTDGRFVFFTSMATNLVSSANMGTKQVFSRWLATSITDHRSRLVNDWAFSPAVNSDGSVVAYETSARVEFADTNDAADVYAAYGGRNQVARISMGTDPAQPNGPSHQPSVSADGNLFAFSSTASNLLQGDTNGVSDVFVRGLLDKNIRRVSVSSSGEQGNKASGPAVISGDGRRVAFCSDASNLVSNDTNNVTDVFVHDLSNHQTVRVSVSSTGAEGNALSCDPSLSGDGRLVAFSSHATNLVPDDIAFPGDTNYEDVFVHDLETHKTVRVSVAPMGTRAKGDSRQPAISANGRVVVFLSDAPNLVVGDTNGWTDAFAFEFTSSPP